MKNYCYVIAEAGLNHNGDFNLAKKLIDVAANAKADAVKFQKRTVSDLAVRTVLDAKDDRFPEFGDTYREIRERHEFDSKQYSMLKEYSEKKGLDFIVTAFDIEAVDFLLNLGIDKFKLASHSLTNIQLLKYLAKKNKDVILSTGMCSFDEIDTAVKIFKDSNSTLKLMHCISSYPTPFEQCNMNLLGKLKERYKLSVGYSGHEIGFLPTLVAVSMGAELVERHYTLDNKMVGFDHKMSLEPQELNEMIASIRSVSVIQGSENKNVTETEWITRKKYHVSIASVNIIKKGTTLLESMVTYKNPGTGIPAKDLDKILNKKVLQDIPADILLTMDMFE